MQSSIAITGRFLTLALCLLGGGAALAAEIDMTKMDPAALDKGFVVAPISKSNKTASGQPLVYPKGQAETTSAIVTIAPGGSTGRHQHPIPQFALVLEGVLSVKADGGKERTYKAGDAFLEDVDLTHEGWNKGKTPVKIFVLYMGAQDAALTVEQK